jgi:hypothetical protein
VSKCKQIGIGISNDQELGKTKNQISLFLWNLLDLFVGQRAREREREFAILIDIIIAYKFL